jgi:replication-associated recombination protein RarA
MEIKTRKNYDFYECSSAFQKSIRRGETEQALFFGWELYASGYSKYCWKRLLIITSEDIGLAEPHAINTVMNLHKAWEIIAESNLEEAGMPFIQAILYLSNCQKSRLIDEYKIYLMKSDVLHEIPEYALDVHTRRGKSMGKNHIDFLINGRVTAPNSDIEVPKHIADFYFKYFTQYAEKKVEITGYDERNVTFKNAKEMEQWKRENSQSKLF